MMAVNETVLGAVLQVVFERLASREVVNFFQWSKFDRSLVEKLKMLMSAIEKLLLDAEQRQMTDCTVGLWLDELKHWFYRAEEVFDQIATEVLRSSLEMKLSSELQSVVTEVYWNLASSSTSSFLNTVTLNIREIVDMLQSMLNKKGALGLRELYVGRAPQRVRTTSVLDECEVYGRDVEKEKIFELLLSEEAGTKGIDVVAIVGAGGLGKTTLANMVYNDARVQKTFELKAWVSVSEKFDISRVTKSIIESVTHRSCSNSLNLLQIELIGMLRDKKFLLVLDDVWNETYDDWEVLREHFLAAALGSKIIITTRYKEVASTMRSKHVFFPEPLSHDDAWSLFSRYAFEGGNPTLDPCLEHIGRKTVQKCQGLPLAIKMLGSLLHSMDDDGWKTIFESIIWGLPNNRSNVIPALWLSYYHLPGYLKRCFSYCTIFPKKYKIDRKQLVFLWMAENFVQPTDDGRRLEDVGNEYLHQLVSLSFLELIDEVYVTMHDLIHDLAQCVSSSFVAVNELESVPQVYERTRHFSYISENYDLITKFQAIRETRFLRTFLQVHAKEWCSYLTSEVSTALKPSLSCLRVISLSGYRNLKLHELMECPKQLCYLDVSRTTIDELPQWVSTLCNLQTLILSDCRYLRSLPTDMSRLVSLRHLDIRGATALPHMPQKMGNLRNLQTLTDFVVGKNAGSGIQELSDLQQLRGKFAIRQLQNVIAVSDAYDADLSNMELVDDLELEFDFEEKNDPNKDKDVLESLKPPLDVERLTIINYGGTTFPKWLDSQCMVYEKMAFLCLCGCDCDSLPPLGQLPSLKHLEIEEMDYVIEVGHEFFCHSSCDPFPALESLSFKSMKGWERWSIPDIEGVVCFPSLTKFSLRNCPKLKGDLPIHIQSLKEVEIYECEELGGSLPGSPSIHELEVVGCPRVELDIRVFDMTSLTSLTLEGLEQLVNLTHGLYMLSSLTDFEIRSCPNLRSLGDRSFPTSCFPSSLKLLCIAECEALEHLPEVMEFPTHLEELSLSWCQRLRWVRGNSLPISLTSLYVDHCEGCDFLIPTDRMQRYTSLLTLSLGNTCSDLVSFPLGVFPNLRYLSFSDCKGLQKVYIPEGTAGNSLRSLSTLYFSGCPKLEMIGKDTERGEATVLPAPNLMHFSISRCEKVKPVAIQAEGQVLLPKLETLTIDKSNKVITLGTAQILRRSLLGFSCLTRLEIRGEEVECFPDPNEDWGSLPPSLSHLNIYDFPRLRKLDGKALQGLTSLQGLSIRGCPKLESLPEEGLPSSLGVLSIERCPMVEERCQPEKGLDWSKIAHIPCIRINSKCIWDS